MVERPAQGFTERIMLLRSRSERSGGSSPGSCERASSRRRSSAGFRALMLTYYVQESTVDWIVERLKRLGLFPVYGAQR